MFLANGHKLFGATTVHAAQLAPHDTATLSFAEFHVHLEALQCSLPVSLFFTVRRDRFLSVI